MKSFRGDLWRSIALAFLMLLCVSSPAFAGSMPAGFLHSENGIHSDWTAQHQIPLPESISSKFADVTPSYWAYNYIERLSSAGITKGCGNGIYCPENTATRAETAVFIERAIHGSNFEPPSASGTFVDVPDGYWAKDWIEQFFLDGITTGSGVTPLKYYPEHPVTRAEMAVFLLRAKHYGKDYSPPAATGIFEDVPVDHWAADWIEALYQENITTGCEGSSMKYCPEDIVSRADMAAYLVRALQPLTQNAIFGYSTANHFFTQAVSNQGMGEQISTGELNNTYHSMTSFTMADGSQYIFGLSQSGDWSIQEVMSTGDLGKEISFGTWEHYYPILSAFTFPGGKTFIYGQMQVTDNEEGSSFWIVMEIKQGVFPEPELVPTLVDDGYWDKWYPNALVTNPNSPSPVLFGEDSDGNWFLRPISADGKVQREDPYMHQFGDYYGSVQTFIVGGEVFLFVQNSDTKAWKIWRITKNEPIGIMDESVWNDYYSTVASYSTNGRTFLFLQSGTYWNIMEVLAGGTMGSQIGADGNWGNHYDFIFPIYVDPAYLNPSSWMTHMYDLIKDRTLQEIAMPGSHDAGMSELEFCSTYGNACNTQTQTGAIYEQLRNGARYFDIRPTSYVDCWGSFIGWYTGHWAYVNGVDWQGCMGQSLDSVLDDVAKFCAEMWTTGGKELIILNFSHCYDIVTGDDCDDWTGSDCTDNEWVDDVRNTAVEKLSAFLIDWSKYEDPREAIFGDRAAIQHVLLRFETGAISSDPQNGVYNSDDFPIYNNYSDTNSFSTMSDDQEQKMINPVIHNAELFLLSWTLTLSGDQAYDCTGFGNPTSILDLAGEADSQLMNNIYDWSSSVITQTLLPNIIYVDNFGTFATRAAIYINQNYSTLPP